jgi:hypothetical protein
MGLEVAGIRAPRCFLINVETAESIDCWWFRKICG